MDEEVAVSAFTIGQVAKQAGVGVETIRFYERSGLLKEPPRNRAGYREYPVDAVARVKFIRRAKDLGFTLNEIADLLALRVDADTTCADVKARAETKIAGIEERIRELQHMKCALAALAASCRGSGPASECPILEALEEERT